MPESPYKSDGVESAPRSLFEALEGYQVPKESRATERGELLKYFSEQLGISIPRVAKKVTGLSVADLYYMKSASDAYKRQGMGPWGKAFNGMLIVRD